MTGIKKLVLTIRFLSDWIYNWVVLKYRKVQIGKDLQINGRIYLVSNTRNGIIIGDNVRINSSKNSNPIGGDMRTVLFAKGAGKIRIGNNCGISNATIFACEGIEIGNNVLIGGGVKVYDTDFHWLDYDRRISERGGGIHPACLYSRWSVYWCSFHHFKGCYCG